MLIHFNPDDYVTDVDRHTCEHHKRQPWDTGWPGCTCSVSYAQRLATPEEKVKKILQREKEEERRKKHMADYDAGRIK